MASFAELLSNLRSNTSRCIDLKWRRVQLTNLLRMFNEQQDAINEALYKDLRRPHSEAMVMEITTIKAEISEALNELDQWTKPVFVKKNLLTVLDSAYTQSQPLGVVLIIGAWNYPFQITLIPLVGAIAAGNCVVVKPSEISHHSCILMEKLIAQYLDNDCIRTVMGGVTETTQLLKEKFDHIFYTGSTEVGRIIYKAASQHLTPVTLELGGKCPVVVDSTSHLATVARRVMWGKLANAGQTCISADYVLVEEAVMLPLIDSCIKAIEEFHNGDSKLTKDYGRIINANHFNRLKTLLTTTTSSFKLGSLSNCDEDDLYIPPILLGEVELDDVVMKDEIFGPILPFVTVKNMDHAIQIINSRPKPLVIYLFTNNSRLIEDFNTRTSSGGLVVNDLFVQMSLTSLPFGGVGDSGIGAYHGKATFNCFSHQRSILVKKQNLEFVNGIRYPPYTDNKLKATTWILNKEPKRTSLYDMWPLIFMASLAIYVLAAMANWTEKALSAVTKSSKLRGLSRQPPADA